MATLEKIQQPGFYERLGAGTQRLSQGLQQVARDTAPDLPFAADAVGGMFGMYFASRSPASYAEVMRADKERFNRFFHAMLDRGVYLAPSAFEAGFVSIAHDDGVIDATLEAAREAFRAIA
jgi:glutamate-1-semialdehyde 2,1-aminomutase